jgi:hypothetical protein
MLSNPVAIVLRASSSVGLFFRNYPYNDTLFSSQSHAAFYVRDTPRDYVVGVST